jgi:tungstate transport system ATP-binding protein
VSRKPLDSAEHAAAPGVQALTSLSGWPPGRAGALVQASPGKSAPLLTLQAASVSFGTTRALQDVSLRLDRGERLALVGANGSGKTTLLRLLHGLQQADRPSAIRRSAARAAEPSSTAHTAAASPRTEHLLQPENRLPVSVMVFQRPFLLHLSVRWNVLLGLWLQGVPTAQRDARCHQALQRVGLGTLAHRPARALSGGQQQRLALARAWAVQPDILFLDEPTASLDPSAKQEVESLVREFADDGVTVVMSTHNLGQAKRLATRVVYLAGGRMVADRPVDEFFDSPDLPVEAQQFLRGELPWRT